ncbi:MAG TPA: hypothetical protein VGG76_10075 [Gemmatimonadaceae bacterium]
MTCQECIEELSTRSLRELPADSAVMEHCATCPDCSRLTTRLREREYEAANILNNLPPMSSPLAVAEHAAMLSRRRSAGRIVVVLSAIAGALVVWVVSATMVVPALSRASLWPWPSGPLGMETIRLACITPDQASDVIRPYLRSRARIYYTTVSGAPAITVRATPAELARSRTLIQESENASKGECQVQPADQMTKMLRDIDGALADEKAADRLTHPQPAVIAVKQK